jgi:aspartyl-tRNA(Asn)/glutamyl-tRNA(Gln) amidotransferase subunit C
VKITDKDVAHVADLANLELSPEERAGMLHDLNSILNYIERLNELDTSTVAPMAQVWDRLGADASTGRDDVHDGLRKSLPRQTALENAPESDGTFFIVPKVIER